MIKFQHSRRLICCMLALGCSLLLAWLKLHSGHGLTGTIIFHGWNSEQIGLYQLDLATDEITCLTPATLYAGYPASTPDGSKVAFVCRESATDKRGICELHMRHHTVRMLFDESDVGTELYPTYAPVWSPDGHTLVFQVAPDELIDTVHLYQFQLESGTISPLISISAANARPIKYWSWSPNGQWLALNLGVDQIGLVNVAEQTWHSLTQGYYPTWMPDSEHLIVLRRGSYYLVDLAGVTVRTLYESDPEASLCAVPEVRSFSNDGRYLAFTGLCGDNDPVMDLYVLDFSTGEVHLVYQFERGVLFAEGLAWLESPRAAP